MVNSSNFLEYLIHLGLFRYTISQNENGITAILRQSDNPNLSDFTQVYRNSDNTWTVRLSKLDYNNPKITKGFFDKLNTYGDKLGEWVDVSFDKTEDFFAKTTDKGTIMYGIDLEHGGFFSAFTTEPFFMEFAPLKSFKHDSLEEAKNFIENLELSNVSCILEV
jgi:hypothetical protein